MDGPEFAYVFVVPALRAAGADDTAAWVLDGMHTAEGREVRALFDRAAAGITPRLAWNAQRLLTPGEITVVRQEAERGEEADLRTIVQVVGLPSGAILDVSEAHRFARLLLSVTKKDSESSTRKLLSGNANRTRHGSKLTGSTDLYDADLLAWTFAMQTAEDTQNRGRRAADSTAIRRALAMSDADGVYARYLHDAWKNAGVAARDQREVGAALRAVTGSTWRERSMQTSARRAKQEGDAFRVELVRFGTYGTAPDPFSRFAGLYDSTHKADDI